MRAVIEKDVLEECFNGSSSDVLIAAHALILGVTEAIINEYMDITDSSGMYKEWFDKKFSVSANHFFIKNEVLTKYGLNKSCINSNYIGAAYHSTSTMIAKSEARFAALSPNDWGISIEESASYRYMPSNNSWGAKVAEIISLKPGGRITPAVLSSYFLKEKRLFIFDKSINARGADFICEITRYCLPDCKVVVMSNFHNNVARSVMGRLELEKYLNANKYNGTISVKQADKSVTTYYHDRFIFLGERLQMTFSSGLDCFGLKGDWANSDGDITVHCIHNSNAFMEFSSGKDRYRLKSKG